MYYFYQTFSAANLNGQIGQNVKGEKGKLWQKVNYDKRLNVNKGWNVKIGEMWQKVKSAKRWILSKMKWNVTKGKCDKRWNKTKGEMWPKLKCDKSWNVAKEEMWQKV